MVRIAQERILALFALAEREAATGAPALADRYVRLARRIGTRYNVRLLPEHRELYCRGCSTYWIEGRTVRTRLRSGRRVRTCLSCGRERRTPIRPPVRGSRGRPERGPDLVARDEGALVAELRVDDGSRSDEDEEAEPE